MNVQLGCAELKKAELKVEVSIGEIEEEIIDDFLNYWVNPDQLDNVKPSIFVADNCDMITGFTEEDVQSCEAITSMGKYLSEEKYSELKNDEEFLLNKGGSDAFMF